jgi:Fe-S-cluster containining protein
MKATSSDDNVIPVGKHVLFPENISRYPCEMCGKCCSNDWIVEMGPDDFKRHRVILEESDLPSDYTKYLQENKSADDSKYKLLPRHGKCIFFMENNKCYIHDKYGHDAKSRTCKIYPLSTSAFSPRGIHLKISFTCDSFLRSLLLPDAIRLASDDWENDIVCTARVQFSVGHSVSWQDFFSINDALASLFLQSAYNIEHNLMLSISCYQAYGHQISSIN